MAEITVAFPKGRAGKRATALWETVTCGDTGSWIELGDFNDNTVSAVGTFNSQTITIQGANLEDKSDAFTVADITGTAITFTTAGGKLVIDAPRYIRPSFSGSSGGDVDVALQMRKS